MVSATQIMAVGPHIFHKMKIFVKRPNLEKRKAVTLDF